MSAQNFESIDFKNGLSQNTVLSMAQDDLGFVWLGTADGLNRFDGSSTRTFRYSNEVENGICGNEIMDIINDGHGYLWIATSTCLNKFSLKDYSFSHFYQDNLDEQTLSGNYISQLEIANNTLCIITENGLDLLNIETEEIVRLKLPENAKVSGLSVLPNKEFLVSTSNGLYIYQLRENTFVSVDDRYDIKYKSENIQKALLDESTLLIAYQNEIVKFDLESGKSKQIFGFDYIDTRDMVRWNDMFFICTSKGIMKYNLDTDTLEYGPRYRFPQGVAIHSFLKSDTEIWFSVGTGVLKYSIDDNLFQTIKIDESQTGLSGDNKVWHICNEEDAIIISTEQGVYFLDANGFVVSIDEMMPLEMNFQFVSNVSRDENNIWISTFDSGIYHVDVHSMKVENYSSTRSGKYFIGSNTVRHSFVDDEEVLFSTDGGLFSFDVGTSRMNEVLFLTNDDNEALAKKTTFCLKDNSGKLWIGTQNGLYVESGNDQFAHYSTATEPALSNNKVKNVYQQSDSVFLVGTSSGLNVFNVKKGNFEYINVNSGLDNDVIYSLEVDDEGDIWVSTNKGISLIHNNGKVLNFNVNDGLQGSEFNTNASAKSNEGYLYFGGLYGISKFDPKKVKVIKDIQSPIITQVEVLQHDDEEGFKLKYPLKEEYEFTYAQCNFIVSFASVNYDNPENNVFHYQLEGYNHEWIEVEGDPEVQFMNLPQGDYNFKIRSSLRNGKLSDKITSLKIRISPSFYKSFIFKLLSLFALITIGFFVYRIRIKSVQSRNKKLKGIVSFQTTRLKEAISLQETFLKEIPEPLVIFNLNEEIAVRNDLYKDLLSKNQNVFIGELSFEGHIFNALKLRIDNLNTQSLTNLESELSVGDRHFQLKFNKIFSNGKDYGTAVLLREVTKVKNAEYLLKQNELLFRSYFEKSPLGIVYVTNPREAISDCNLKFCEMLGFDKATVLTKTMTDLTFSEDLEKDMKNFKSALDARLEYTYEPNKRLVGVDGKVIMTETHVTFIYENNELKYLFALIQDVTEQREGQKNLIEARTQLIQSEKMAALGQITAGVAHEINNPVNFIYNGVNNLKLLVDTLKDTRETKDLDMIYDDIQQMIDAIEDGARRTTEIVRSLSSFTREDTKSMVFYDIILGIESTIKLLSNRINENVTITRNYSSEQHVINCYPGQLNQVFMNLILNAIDSIAVSGTIDISLSTKDNNTIISISDTGSGIAPAISKMVFEPFFSTKGPKHGTGLGLSISNSIIKKHKGSISFVSNEPHGTICIISLPS